jgi:hypothetical protein
MVLNFGGGGLLGKYTENYSDEFFSTETESGWGGQGIKSVQYGYITTANGASSGTATITAVDINNSYVAHLGDGMNNSTGAYPANQNSYLVLTNATTVTATRSGTTSARITCYMVVEYYPGTIKSIQNTSAPNDSTSVTIQAVNPTKTILIYRGCLRAITSTDGNFRSRFELILASATTVTSGTYTIVGDAESGTSTLYFTVVEFY